MSDDWDGMRAYSAHRMEQRKLTLDVERYRRALTLLASRKPAVPSNRVGATVALDPELSARIRIAQEALDGI